MKRRHEELIATVLGDARPTTALRQWLRTAEGRRERAAYSATLRVLEGAYGDGSPLLRRAPVYYTTIQTPIGRVLVAATSAGLARVSFRRDEAAVVAELRQRLRAEVEQSAGRLAAIIAQIEAYFAGDRRTFDLPLDLSLATPFQRQVLAATREVAPGEVASYGEIAKRIGKPKASRAVGQVLGHNPVPIVIPCHRVVAGGGALGGYTGGLAIKRKLLALERAELGTEC